MLVAPVIGVPPPVGLLARFASIMGGLRAVVAAHVVRDRNSVPLIRLICAMLSRRHARFRALVARFHAGALNAPARESPVAPSEPERPKRPPRERAPDPLPRGAAWLLIFEQETSVYGRYLRELLKDPEMLELLAAAPQAGRLLRPLLRMLSKDPLPAVLQITPSPQRVGRQARARESSRASPGVPRTRAVRRDRIWGFGPVKRA